ncbi:MAG: hypothetical protein ACI4ML_11785 [Aristaeellaceae bacterium]
MGFFNLCKKKKTASKPSSLDNTNSREELYNNLLKQMALRTPSDLFVSGAVFDFTRLQHDVFEKIVRSGNGPMLERFFMDAYILFWHNPSIVGMPKNFVIEGENDTNLKSWNFDIFPFQNGDVAVLCFIPIQNNSLEARIIGIILSEFGDGYYYCMLNKDKSAASTVIRNKAMHGISHVGEVKGRGFELMKSFLSCIKNDFYSAM